MSSGIVKKVRGRPPKSSIIKHEVKDIDSNRKSGRMSLRPNKRVKLSRDEYDDLDSIEDNELILPEKIDVDIDVDEHDYIGDQYDDNETLDDTDENLEDLCNRDALKNHRRRSRKMIIYNPKMAVKMRKEQLKNDTNDGGTYDRVFLIFLDHVDYFT